MGTTPSQEAFQDTTLLLLASAQSFFSTFTTHLISSWRMMRNRRNVDSMLSLSTAVLLCLVSSTCSQLRRALVHLLLIPLKASRNILVILWCHLRVSYMLPCLSLLLGPIKFSHPICHKCMANRVVVYI